MSDVKVFALDTVERAVKTIVQGAAGGAVLVLSTVDGSHVASVAWWQQVLLAAAAGGVSGLVSVLSSIGSAVKTGTASLSRTVAATAVPQPTLETPAPVAVPEPSPVVDVPDPLLGAPVYPDDPAPVAAPAAS